MITITRKGLQLAINNEVIPAQGSSDVPIQFINDDETYRNYLIEPRVGWYKNGFPKSTVARYEEGIIYLPVEVFIKNGPIAIVIALIDPQNSNHIEVTHSVISAIANAPLGDIILPEKETWEQAVASLVKQLNEQIQADVAEAIKKANKASEDATAALTKSNQTNQTINDKIEDGSFVPQATAGTVEMTQPGTKAEVTITGDKKNPEFNFKIPKDEIDDSEDIKKALLQGTYTTDLSEEYKGVASDYGAEILKIEGKSEQATTNGYQLFDASKLPTKTYGGATVTNNGDGSFTVSGSGNLTEVFLLNYVYSQEETQKLLKKGTLKINGLISLNPYFAAGLVTLDGATFISDKKLNYEITSIEITEEDLKNTRFRIVFYGTSNNAIKAGTIKPMLYQEGDGTWEPFTGGESSPNPNYPQEIRNALDEPLVSVSRNLCNDKDGYSYSPSYKHISTRSYIRNVFKKMKPNTKYTIFIYGLSFINKMTSFQIRDRDGKNPNCTTVKLGGLNKCVFKTIEILNPFKNNVLFFYTKELTEIEQAELKNLKVMIVEGDYSSDDLPYEPHKYAETPLNIELRSLSDGTCDVYEKGTITRMIDYKEYDGSSDENWKLQSINSNGIANFNIAISSSIKVAGSMCNRFIFDKSSISVATKEAYHLNDNNFFIRLKKETASTVEEFKVWLNEHPVRLLYQRPTPITEKVELPIVPTFYPYTNIYQVDDVKAKIQYGLRSKVEECPYDIGDLYITLNETLPSVKWKGTKWERVEGFVPVGYKASDADFGTLGKTGGAKTVTLTEEQMPDHNHSAKAKKAANHKHGIALKTATGSATPHTGPGVKEGSWSSTDTHAWLDKSLCEEAGEHDHIITVENAGGSQAHNNLQPYKVFNMWVRTA